MWGVGDLREFVRILGALARGVNELKQSVWRETVQALGIDRILIYDLSDAQPEDTEAMRAEVARALGGGEDLSETLKGAIGSEPKRRISMGGKKVALIFVWPGIRRDPTLPDRLRERLSPLPLGVRTFDASSYPLAAVQEAAEYGPDEIVVVGFNGKRSREAEPGRVVRYLKSVSIPNDRVEASEGLGPVLSGEVDVDGVAYAAALLARKAEIWILECSIGADVDVGWEADEVCLDSLARELKSLLREMGFSS
ncbi:MAG TPA: hypothetical protein ENF83_00900 [Candidatus Korarchaeota archaeon]|nr:MAG: hypothetical protein DRO01_03795 [Candidatus Korarchaeota archaeon]HDI85950.1 hypothetical protein [Candidatus Korarchaeota archaeon]